MKDIKGFFSKLLVPSEENNFRAKTLHPDFLILYLIIALFLSFFSKNLFRRVNNVLGYATDITVEKLYQLTNKERLRYNLPPLAYNEKLAQAAFNKAEDMFKNNYWAHYSPQGHSPWDFILSVGYEYEYAGENLAKNFLFSQDVIDAWMNSKTHRENMLRAEYTEVGFAVVDGVLNGEETTLVVQMFGRPLVPHLAQKRGSKKNFLLNQARNNSFKDETKRQPMVLAKTVAQPRIKIFNYSLSSVTLFLVFLVVVLLFDYLVAVKLHIVRVTGKNLAHIFFIIFIIAGLWFITKGAIL